MDDSETALCNIQLGESKAELVVPKEFSNCLPLLKYTIEEFIKSGINISEAARKLYVHRNTLIYRLEKIYRETSYDIRNFKETTIFIIGFLVWKSSVD